MRNHKLFWQSSYDRGIQHLLVMWPEIKKTYPDATLEVCYGWTTFDSAYRDNPERQAWKAKIEALFNQDGITHHGKIGQDKMRELRKTCGIWSYPTEFTEIFCIGAVECQSDGLVPVVINLAALDETVGSGIKVSGDIYDQETKDEYLKQLLSLMGDEKKWEEESKKGIEFAKSYSWDKISDQWINEFKTQCEHNYLIEGASRDKNGKLKNVWRKCTKCKDLIKDVPNKEELKNES